MFGVSFSEVFAIAVVALLAIGPKNLPKALGTLGNWVAKLRRIGNEVRYQIGVDDLLRQEGLSGGINELRSLMRGGIAGVMTQPAAANAVARTSNYAAVSAADSRDVADDRSREYPTEGADAYGAIPDDLLPDESGTSQPAQASQPTQLPKPAQLAAPPRPAQPAQAPQKSGPPPPPSSRTASKLPS